MSFEILWDQKAVLQLQKLPKDVASRIVKKVKLVGETGLSLEILREHKYGFKIRVGDYRALCDVYYNPNKIVIRTLGHRSKIYKR